MTTKKFIAKFASIFLIIYTLNINFTFGQETVLKGIVIDQRTQKGIPYVNIFYVENQTGTAADSFGFFTIQHLKSQSKIKISAVGYESTIAELSKLNVNILNSIELLPIEYNLKEVIVSRSSSKRKKQLIGNYSKEFSNYYWGMSEGHQIALFIKDNEHYGCKIEDVIFKIRKDNKVSCYPLLRIRLLSNNITQHEPMNDLIIENIVINPDKYRSKVTVDVSNYNLVLPKEGVWVCFDFLKNPMCNNSNDAKIKLNSIYMAGQNNQPYSITMTNYRNKKWNDQRIHYRDHNYPNPSVGLNVR